MKEESSPSLRSWTQRFKLAFSRPELDAKVDLLEKYTTKLRVLCEQVETLEKETNTRLTHSKPLPRTTAPYRVKRNASQRLYDTLSQVWSCSKHLEHSANICLDESPTRIQSDKIYFDMIFTFSGSLDSASGEAPMRVTIESMLERSDDAADTNTQAEPATITALRQETITNTVSFALPVIIESTVQAGEPLDLCSVQNICFHLQKCLQTTSAPSPIGYLQRTKTFQCLVYPPRTTTLCTSPAISLNDIIRAAQTSGGIWIPEKLRLAKLLALAVLQFHSTPWLDGRWRSQNVLFFDPKKPTQDSFGSPYLAARFAKPLETTARKVLDRGDPRLEPLPAPNAILFRLGVILLEIGLETPFSDLQEPKEREQGFFTEYLAALRLGRSSTVSSKMGSRYGKLVNRCLFCDFGLGGNYELDMVDLQSMFFQYVVMELDECFDVERKLDGT